MDEEDAFIRVAATDGFLFSNANENDLCIGVSSAPTQRVLIGTAATDADGAAITAATVTIDSANVAINGSTIVSQGLGSKDMNTIALRFRRSNATPFISTTPQQTVLSGGPTTTMLSNTSSYSQIAPTMLGLLAGPTDVGTMVSMLPMTAATFAQTVNYNRLTSDTPVTSLKVTLDALLSDSTLMMYAPTSSTNVARAAGVVLSIAEAGTINGQFLSIIRFQVCGICPARIQRPDISIVESTEMVTLGPSGTVAGSLSVTPVSDTQPNNQTETQSILASLLYCPPGNAGETVLAWCRLLFTA